MFLFCCNLLLWYFFITDCLVKWLIKKTWSIVFLICIFVLLLLFYCIQFVTLFLFFITDYLLEWLIRKIQALLFVFWPIPCYFFCTLLLTVHLNDYFINLNLCLLNLQPSLEWFIEKPVAMIVKGSVFNSI